MDANTSTQGDSNIGVRGGGHPEGYTGQERVPMYDVKHVKEEDGHGGDAGDFQYAVSLQQELARPTRRKQSAVTYLDNEGDSVEDDYEDEDKKTRVRLKVHSEGFSVPSTSRTSRATEFADSQSIQFEDDSDDEEALRQAELAKKRKMIAPIMLPEEELAAMDDEVEMVINHRTEPNAHENEGEYNKIPLSGSEAWKHWQFYVKWARTSHIHNSWDSYQTLSMLGGFKRVANYCKRVDAMNLKKASMSIEEKEEVEWRENMEQELLEEHQQIERVFGERLHEGVVQYLVKWKGLPYGDATWESRDDILKIQGGDMIEAFQAREQHSMEPRQTVDSARKNFIASGHVALAEQPSYLKCGTLRDYQLAGLNWMVYNWSRGVNGILADEMGLGKTIQCASFVGYLSEIQKIGQPMLVVVPLSTVPNWAKEFSKWIPDVNALVYVGNSASREVIRHFEFPTVTSVPGRQAKFDALITTYEMVLKDSATLRELKWSALIVDEAHRLKNTEAALYKELCQWPFKSKLLVTGTPLQNNIKELWALLHFLHPNKFPSSETFEETYDLKDPAGVERLHNVLRPHLLRRVIKDVEKSLPPKRERILRVPMTPLQKQYYKWILTRNFTQLNKNSKGSQIKLLNIIVDLKKCCNHPFLFESARENYQATTGKSEDIISNLVVTSGKMVLLDKLLGRLKETGHRVLIFSQMVRVLDIISEYMNRKGYRHQRLDGSTPSHKRHQAMDRFNAPDSQDFAFLLSTRAGGLGINLATADTVLLFDSDWNPQNDLQAMARAHRIGQKDSVNIYRFVTGGSVEEDILERAKGKMILDHLVIQKMDTSGRTVLGKNSDSAAGAKIFKKEELAEILKFGAEDLFKEAPEDAAGEKKDGTLMTDEDLDGILARAEEIEHTNDQSAQGSASDLLSSFKVATFKGEEDDAAFWDRLIPENMRPQEKEEVLADPGIRQARLKAMENSSEANGHNTVLKLSTKKKKAVNKDMPGPSIPGAELRIDKWPQAVDEEGRLVADEAAPRPQTFPHNLSKRDGMQFIKSFKRYPHIFKLRELATFAGGSLADLDIAPLQALWYGLLRGCEKAVDSFQKKNSGKQFEKPASGPGSRAKGPEPHLDFFGVDVRANEILSLARQMKILDEKVLSKLHEEGLGEESRMTATFTLDAHEAPPITAWMRGSGWTIEDDSNLIIGAYRYGIGDWESIYNDQSLKLSNKIFAAVDQANTPPDALPKASHLETRVYGILRQMEKSKTSISLKRKRQESKASESRKNADQKIAAQLGNDVIVVVRKLRTLQRQGPKMDVSTLVNKTRKYMEIIGTKIDSVCNTNKSKLKYWDFVSHVSENTMDANKLMQVYLKLVADKEETRVSQL